MTLNTLHVYVRTEPHYVAFSLCPSARQSAVWFANRQSQATRCRNARLSQQTLLSNPQQVDYREDDRKQIRMVWHHQSESNYFTYFRKKVLQIMCISLHNAKITIQMQYLTCVISSTQKLPGQNFGLRLV